TLIMPSLIKIVALACIVAVCGAEVSRDKRQLFVDPLSSSVVDPYVDPIYAPPPRVIYRRPTVVVQRPSYYPELYSRPMVRAYRPIYREVLPQMFAEPQHLLYRRPAFAITAPAPTVISPAVGPTFIAPPAVPLVAPSVVGADILIKKKKL
ncbi:hypothetical protein PENTCL1PPCAC_18638, partial [Pristionchus entomophagus]